MHEPVAQVDTAQIVEDALTQVANAIALGTLHFTLEEPIDKANKSIIDSLHFLHKSFENLSGNQDSFVWEQVRKEFVENFSRLVNRSHNQVGLHTN